MNSTPVEMALAEAVAGKAGWSIYGTEAVFSGRLKARLSYRPATRRWSLRINTLSGAVAKRDREFVSRDPVGLVTFAMHQQPQETACDECDECQRCQEPNYGAWRQGECLCREDSTCVIYRNILQAVGDDRRFNF